MFRVPDATSNVSLVAGCNRTIVAEGQSAQHVSLVLPGRSPARWIPHYCQRYDLIVRRRPYGSDNDAIGDDETQYDATQDDGTDPSEIGSHTPDDSTNERSENLSHLARALLV
jgi:hypothetical protein